MLVVELMASGRVVGVVVIIKCEDHIVVELSAKDDTRWKLNAAARIIELHLTPPALTAQINAVILHQMVVATEAARKGQSHRYRQSCIGVMVNVASSGGNPELPTS